MVINTIDIQTSNSLDKTNQVADAVSDSMVFIAIDAASLPTAVLLTSASGTQATTGTAIITLNGAAATSATLAAIGTPVSAFVFTTTGVIFAPIVVGGVVVSAAGAVVGAGVNEMIESVKENEKIMNVIGGTLHQAEANLKNDYRDFHNTLGGTLYYMIHW